MGTHMSLMFHVLAPWLLNLITYRLGLTLPGIIYGVLGVVIVMILEIPVIYLLNGRLKWLITPSA